MNDIVIVSYGRRADDRRVGREAMVARRKNDTNWLDGEIVKVKSEYRRNLNMKKLNTVCIENC